KRAHDVRRLAESVADPLVKRELIDIAYGYERIANMARDQKAGRQMMAGPKQEWEGGENGQPTDQISLLPQPFFCGVRSSASSVIAGIRVLICGGAFGAMCRSLPSFALKLV